ARRAGGGPYRQSSFRPGGQPLRSHARRRAGRLQPCTRGKGNMITQVDFASVESAVQDVKEWLSRVALIVAPPVLRIALAVPFFKSGMTKWDGFLSLSPAAEFLFEDEFKLHIFGQVYDFPLPTAFAYLDSVAEIVLPVLLVIGLATRFSALA